MAPPKKQKEHEEPLEEGAEEQLPRGQRSTMEDMKLADAAVKLLRDRTSELFSEAGKSPSSKAAVNIDAAVVLTVRQVRNTVGSDGAAYLALKALLPRDVAGAACDVAEDGEPGGDRMKMLLKALDFDRRQALAAAWAVRAVNHTRQGVTESTNSFGSRLEAALRLATSLGAKMTEISGRRVLENARLELKHRVLDDKFLVATAAVELDEGNDELKKVRASVLRGELTDDDAFVDALAYREAMALLRAAEALGTNPERDLPGAAMVAAVSHSDELAAMRAEVKRLTETVSSLTKMVQTPPPQRGQAQRVKNCWTCGAPGHFAAQCRSRQGVAASTPPASAAPTAQQATSGAAAVSILSTSPDSGKV